jgi:hypothetical protein
LAFAPQGSSSHEVFVIRCNRDARRHCDALKRTGTSLNDFLKHAQLFSLSAEVSPSEFVIIAPSPGADEAESAPRAAPAERMAAPVVK